MRGQLDEAEPLAEAVTACGERFGEENLLASDGADMGRLLIMGAGWPRDSPCSTRRWSAWDRAR